MKEARHAREVIVSLCELSSLDVSRVKDARTFAMSRTGWTIRGCRAANTPNDISGGLSETNMLSLKARAKFCGASVLDTQMLTFRVVRNTGWCCYQSV